MANNNYKFFENRDIIYECFLNNKAKGVPNDDLPGLLKFDLSLLYPGAVFGIGIPISSLNENDYSIAINLDYVSGEPIYPSSSLKGIIRSTFKSKNFIKEIFNTYELNDKDISDLEELVFDGNRVTFFDVLFRIGSNTKIEEANVIDYIVPHSDPSNTGKDYSSTKFNDLVKNPNINKMIKVPENTSVEFRFLINDIDVNEKTINKQDLLNAFKDILLFIGIGAKTNQGYGRLKQNQKEN